MTAALGQVAERLLLARNEERQLPPLFMPVSRGERWSTALKGIGLAGASVDFT